jgi:hypothetical protein
MAIINFNSISGVSTISVASSITVGNNVAIGTDRVTATTFSGNLSGNVTGTVNSSGIATFSNGLVVSAGTTAAPSITPTGDSNTGIFFPAADTIAFAEGGVEAARLDSSGRLGIGTTTPINKLDVIGNTYVSGSVGVGTTAPASTVRLDVVGGIKGTIVQGTSQVSTAGTSIDFTGIPSWVKRVTVMFNGVSTNGTSNLQIQVGAGSVTTSGYSSVSSATGGGTNITPTAVVTSGMVIRNETNAGGGLLSGIIHLTNITGNTWVSSHTFCDTGTARVGMGGGNIALSGTLDRVRITTVNGTDTFDAGSINILYEG